MTPTTANTLIALVALLVLAMSWAAIALWRMGTSSTKVEARAAAVDAAAALCKAAADAAQAAARELGESMRQAVREFQQDVQDVRQEMADLKARWREAHDVAAKVQDHETRLAVLEDWRDRSPQVSGRVAEDGAPIEGLFDVRSERKPR